MNRLGLWMLYATVFPFSLAAQSFSEHASRMLNHLRAHRFDSVYAAFDENMQDQITVRQLGLMWTGMEKQAEGLVATGTPDEQCDDYCAVYIPCTFRKTELTLALVYDSLGRIGGLRLIPPKPKCDYSKPAYAPDSLAYSEHSLPLVNGKYRMPGILCVPRGAGPFPVVILVHGSGPNDKDETTGNYKLFKDLALGLAAKGIATYRYDKRTRVYGKKMVEDMDSLTVHEEVIADAVQAVQLMGKQQLVDPKQVFLLGHSLGAMLAPRIAAAAPSLHGIVLMAGNARPLTDVLWDQYNYLVRLDTQVTAEEQTFLDTEQKKLELLKGDFRLRDADELPLSLPAAYWYDLMQYNQVQQALRLKIPIVIMQGGKDYQVTTADYTKWKAELRKRKKTTFLFYPNLNHLFVTGSAVSTPEDYHSGKGNVPAEVVNDLAGWVQQNRR